jgi:hypothetical protein
MGIPAFEMVFLVPPDPDPAAMRGQVRCLVDIF